MSETGWKANNSCLISFSQFDLLHNIT